MRYKRFLAISVVTLTILLLLLALALNAWGAEYKELYQFEAGADGKWPASELIFDNAGNLYGTTSGGLNRYGSVFKLTPGPDGSWTESTIFRFGGQRAGRKGRWPHAGLTLDSAGNLYGTAEYGGAYDRGTAFKLTPNPDGSWSGKVLHSFNGADGARPWGGLIFDSAGNLYGTTEWGGTDNLGTVFKLTPKPDGSWKRSILHNFKGPDGAWPLAGLIFDAAGNLYGTSNVGGAHDAGTVFALTPNPDGTWSESVLHSFNGSDGASPWAGLILDAAGNLYGTTSLGGASPCYGQGCGTVFMLAPNPDGTWTHTVLLSFSGADGALPQGGLILNAAGNLFGSTESGGPYSSGTVFKMARQPDGQWQLTQLHAFRKATTYHPRAGLTMDAHGNLYGTTYNGGRMDICRRVGCGGVFEIIR